MLKITGSYSVIEDDILGDEQGGNCEDCQDAGNCQMSLP